jgi:5-oxoprolinase (ATP-hydrolysing)
MTNTRITDPEILERRYPVILREFSIRAGSGGQGAHNGGDGVVRDIEFLEPNIHVSILSERRVFHPYGLQGGEDGECGRNLWIRQREDGEVQVLNLGGKNTAVFGKGDRIVILTPGGGGWGKRQAKEQESTAKTLAKKLLPTSILKAGGSLGEYKAMSESA